MDQKIIDTQAVNLSVRFYRLLVMAYPSNFRREYGKDMLQVFRDCCRRSYQAGGSLTLLALWMRTLFDWFKTVLEEQLNRGTEMTRKKFIRLSGWALILGSISITVGWLASTRPEYSQFNAASLPIDRYANLVAFPLFTLGLILTSLGLLGLLARYGVGVGWFGRITLMLGALSGLVSALGTVGLAIFDSEAWWSMFFLGWTLQYLMLALFGLVCLRRNVLLRWNGLPLLAGIWVPLMVTLTGIYEAYTGSWLEVSDLVFGAVFLIGLVGFLWLGYLLQADNQPKNPAAGAA